MTKDCVVYRRNLRSRENSGPGDNADRNDDTGLNQLYETTERKLAAPTWLRHEVASRWTAIKSILLILLDQLAEIESNLSSSRILKQKLELTEVMNNVNYLIAPSFIKHTNLTKDVYPIWCKNHFSFKKQLVSRKIIWKPERLYSGTIYLGF